MSQSHVWENSNSSYSANSFDDLFNSGFSFDSDNERNEILKWLSPLEPWIRHHDIRERRFNPVGDWLLQTEEYRNWFEGTRGGEPGNPALFCYGAPGVGKTYISPLVIDRLRDRAIEQNLAVACFYIDFAAREEQSPTKILSSLLKQIVSRLERIPTKIAQAFRDQEKVDGGRELRLGEIVEMLQDISSSRRTFICIDALDECIVEYREKLLDSLKQILHRSPSVRIFLAGRLPVRDEVEKHFAGRVVAVSVTPTKDDIITFLRAKLSEDITPDAMDMSLEEDIIKVISETVSETFLLVSLNIDAILQEMTIRRGREKLSTMRDGLGLGGAYDAIIERIRAQKGDRARLGMAALMWISHSERPLNVDEICHALAVEIGSTNINVNNVPSIRTVLDCCQGLAIVDEESSTIRLNHFTLKEYLSGHADLFDRPHSRIAETCLTYLNFRAIKDFSASPSWNLRGIPLLGYSSLYWGTHMRMELSDRAKCLAFDLLDQCGNHVFTKLLLESTTERRFNSPKQFSALRCISYFGIDEVAIDLIKRKRWNVNQKDSAGLTLLMWAARYGREEVVKLLLQQEVTRPDIPDTRYGRTALSWAAESGHEGVVRLFLDRRFVNPRSVAYRWGKAPQVMGLLAGGKYVNPDKPGNDGRTQLSLAAKNGHDGIVKLLLGRGDVSPDRSDNDGQTPLSLAAENGHGGVVELLLGREGVSPNRPDNDGQTPLSLAAGNGHGGVVELLLGREDVSPDRLDNYGRTPLSLAAGNGHGGVVELLLGREDVSPDRLDNDGQTPLSLAAGNGHGGVIELLLGREDVNSDRPDNHGQTPLLWAARFKHKRVVRLLKALRVPIPGVV